MSTFSWVTILLFVFIVGLVIWRDIMFRRSSANIIRCQFRESGEDPDRDTHFSKFTADVTAKMRAARSGPPFTHRLHRFVLRNDGHWRRRKPK